MASELTGIHLSSIPEPSAAEPFKQLEWLVDSCAGSYDNEASMIQFKQLRGPAIDFATVRYGVRPFHIRERFTPLSLLHFREYLLERRNPAHPRHITSKTAETLNDRFKRLCDYAFDTARLIDEPVIPIPLHRGDVLLETDTSTAFSFDRLEALTAVVRRMTKRSESYLKPYAIQGIGTDPRIAASGWNSWENVIWYFENVLQAQPLPSTAKNRVSIDGFSTFAKKDRWGNLNDKYEKLGVLCLANLNVIFPLMLDLALETGLNLESLKTLKIDCYYDKHPLTGRPFLAYNKTRSGGDKDLDIEIADDSNLMEDLNDESHKNESTALWPNESKAVRIKWIITTVLLLTARARSKLAINDPRHSLLFIYEDTVRGPKKPPVGASDTEIRSLETGHRIGNFTGWVRRILKPLVLDELIALMRSRTPEDGWAAGEAKLRQDVSGESFSVRKLRATVATQLVIKGAPIEAIQAFLGHKNLWTTLKYIDRHALQLRFFKDMSKYLSQIRDNAAEHRNNPLPVATSLDHKDGQHIFECGITHCRNPYDPPENIRRSRDFIPGQACGQWNKCLFCRNVVVTPFSLPKIIAMQRNIEATLKQELQLTEPKIALLLRLRSVIADLLESDIFSGDEITRARYTSEVYSEHELDALLVNGIRSWA